MIDEKKKIEPPLFINMKFKEALARFAATKPPEVDESIDRSKTKKPPQSDKTPRRAKIKNID